MSSASGVFDRTPMHHSPAVKTLDAAQPRRSISLLQVLGGSAMNLRAAKSVTGAPVPSVLDEALCAQLPNQDEDILGHCGRIGAGGDRQRVDHLGK